MIRCGECKDRHETVAEVHNCHADAQAARDTYEWEMSVGVCSICDGLGHGYPGGRPCPLEENEVARWEDEEDERRAAAFS